MDKIEVNGENAHPVFRHLRRYSNLYDEKTGKAKQVPWNFSKFLVNQKGEVVKYDDASSKVESFRDDIKKLLE